MNRLTTSGAYGGGLIALLSSLSINEWAAISGMVIGFLTCGINWYYRHQDYKNRLRLARVKNEE